MAKIYFICTEIISHPMCQCSTCASKPGSRGRMMPSHRGKAYCVLPCVRARIKWIGFVSGESPVAPMRISLQQNADMQFYFSRISSLPSVNLWRIQFSCNLVCDIVCAKRQQTIEKKSNVAPPRNRIDSVVSFSLSMRRAFFLYIEFDSKSAPPLPAHLRRLRVADCVVFDLCCYFLFFFFLLFSKWNLLFNKKWFFQYFIEAASGVWQMKNI